MVNGMFEWKLKELKKIACVEDDYVAVWCVLCGAGFFFLPSGVCFGPCV
jgi:hypothetical protein